MRSAVVKLNDYLWRPLTGSDADADYVVALRNTERFRPMFYNSARVTREAHRKFIEAANERGEINWLVEHASEDGRGGKPVGVASIYNIDKSSRKAECGRIAANDPRVFQLNWVVSACIGMDVMGTNKIYIETLEENRIIARGVERMGMIREGLLRHHVIRDGVPLNVLLYTNLKSEWDAMRERHYAKWGTPQVISFEGEKLI
jgi:RimJ/RimL family protein N-acetyltransferase